MKKTAPAKKPLQKGVKMTSTNQIILAAIIVLLVFLAALLSTPQKKEQASVSPAKPVLSEGEVRSGSQIARISIVRGDQTQQGVLNNTTGFTAPAATSQSTGTLEVKSGTPKMTEAATGAPAAPREETAAASQGTVAAGNRVAFKIDTFQKLAVQPLKFKVFDDRGRELTPDYLQTVREHKMHFFVVSANLREFQHLFPQYVNGQWNVNAYMPNPGTYYAFTDITPVKGNREVLRSELTVREATKGDINYPGLTPGLLAISDGTSATMELQGIGLGAENVLTFSLSRDGKSLSGVTPYTGAFGYATVMRHGDAGVFLAGRPLAVTDEDKGVFDFAAKFTKAGRYTAFAEFKSGGKVLIFPITFDMP